MAGPPKKKAVVVEDGSGSSAGESDSESIHGQQEIQTDFEGRNPDSQDFHGIKQLLHQLFLKAHINLSEMSDLLIAQAGVGSVLKQSMDDDEDEDDEEDCTMSDALDVFGITSVLNLTKNKQSSCVQEFTDLLKELSLKHAANDTQAEIINILKSNKKLGLLINERFVNIPAKISDPLLSSLLSELDSIKKKDISYDFDYFIMISKFHKEKTNSSEIIFANAEEELFEKAANCSFEFCVQNDSDSTVAGKWTENDVELVPYRKVLLFSANKLANIIQQVKVLVN